MIDNEMKCERCDKTISWNIARASMNVFRHAFCIRCQIAEVRATWNGQPELRDRKIKQLEQYLGLGS